MCGAALQPENTDNIAKTSNGANLANLVFNMFLLRISLILFPNGISLNIYSENLLVGRG
jgi:cell division protein FtsX